MSSLNVAQNLSVKNQDRIEVEKYEDEQDVQKVIGNRNSNLGNRHYYQVFKRNKNRPADDVIPDLYYIHLSLSERSICIECSLGLQFSHKSITRVMIN